MPSASLRLRLLLPPPRAARQPLLLLQSSTVEASRLVSSRPRARMVVATIQLPHLVQSSRCGAREVRRSLRRRHLR